MTATMSSPASADGGPHRVFLKHLYMSVTEKDLLEAMTKLGVGDGVVNVALIKKGRFDANRTINAFITYEEESQMAAAIETLRGELLNGWAKYPAEAEVAYPRRSGNYWFREPRQEVEKKEHDDEQQQEPEYKSEMPAPAPLPPAWPPGPLPPHMAMYRHPPPFVHGWAPPQFVPAPAPQWIPAIPQPQFFPPAPPPDWVPPNPEVQPATSQSKAKGFQPAPPWRDAPNPAEETYKETKEEEPGTTPVKNEEKASQEAEMMDYMCQLGTALDTDPYLLLYDADENDVDENQEEPETPVLEEMAKPEKPPKEKKEKKHKKEAAVDTHRKEKEKDQEKGKEKSKKRAKSTSHSRKREKAKKSPSTEPSKTRSRTRSRSRNKPEKKKKDKR